MHADPLKAGWAPPASAVPEGTLSSVVLTDAGLLRGAEVLSEGSEGSKLPPAQKSPVGSGQEGGGRGAMEDGCSGQMEHHSWESGRHLALPVSQVNPSSWNFSLPKSKLKENDHLSRTDLPGTTLVAQWQRIRLQCRRPGSGRTPGEGNGNPLQYSCLGNPMDRGAWQATVHGIAKELDMM